jgi:nickel/cobalt exporter
MAGGAAYTLTDTERSEPRRTMRIIARNLVLGLVAAAALATTAAAHPLGNFTVNQYTGVEARTDRVAIHYVVDMAEVPTLQEMRAIDADADGEATPAELERYARAVAERAVGAIEVYVGTERVALRAGAASAELLPGAGGLQALRVVADLDGAWPAGALSTARRVRVVNAGYPERLGWREVVLSSGPGVAVFDATAYGTSASNELRAYPEDSLAAPLDERAAEFSVAAGAAPAGARALIARDGRAAAAKGDALADLIAVPELTLGTALLGLLIAAGLGALHALSPGHGKAVVGAYLVGSRGTARHAAFLGATVTVTHTAGVFALGVVTLFASSYVLPEQLFPVLSLASGAVVLAMGLSLFVTRLRHAFDVPEHHHHDHDASAPHSHGGAAHSHLPPGSDGAPITWRSLLALGVSGGLLPCPSALVVLLSAIALQRVGYGLLLVVAFSAGLAGTLTVVGLLFLYAGRWVESTGRASALVRWMPVASALVIACLGAAICIAALGETGAAVAAAGSATSTHEEPSLEGLGALGVLGLGLVFGLKHATEADHVIAVSAIVSEHKRLARAALVGALWGAGHTLSLVVVGAVVLVMRITIPDVVASWLEFGVALMIIGLGAAALHRGLRMRSDVHVHKHEHGGREHAHVHFHEHEGGAVSHPAAHTHAVTRIGLKPLVVGAVHGLAGSAALTLLVLTQIASPWLGMVYLLVFGVGSVGGMLIMSGLVGLPFALTAGRLNAAHHTLQIVAGAVSVLFGIWYAYESGAATSLVLMLVA